MATATSVVVAAAAAAGGTPARRRPAPASRWRSAISLQNAVLALLAVVAIRKIARALKSYVFLRVLVRLSGWPPAPLPHAPQADDWRWSVLDGAACRPGLQLGSSTKQPQLRIESPAAVLATKVREQGTAAHQHAPGRRGCRHARSSARPLVALSRRARGGALLCPAGSADPAPRRGAHRRRRAGLPGAVGSRRRLRRGRGLPLGWPHRPRAGPCPPGAPAKAQTASAN